MERKYTIDAIHDGTASTLSRSQIRALLAIEKEIPKFDFYGDREKYEIKLFEIKQFSRDPDLYREPGPVYVTIITGLKNDAGTMAEIYCRKYRHFSIGPRGGIKTYIINHSTHSAWQSVSMFDLLNSHYE